MDATAPALVSFIDYVLDQVRALADDGNAFGGYISMRFMYSSPEYLAMQRWPSTCCIEIAGLSRVDGTDPLMVRLEEESRARNIVLHWGQRNNRLQADIEESLPADDRRLAQSVAQGTVVLFGQRAP